jgi:hypothetical protein
MEATMQNVLNPSDILTRNQAAEYLHICRTTLDRLNLPRVRIRRRVFFRKATLDQWILEREVSKEAQA